MPEPRYTMIAADIANKIRTGVWPPKTKLPSTSELRAQYGVSAMVIRLAMVDLKARGLVEGQQGKGVYVLEQPPPS